MKKKLFSLMMMLLLAFMGVARAETIEIGDGTGTTFYAPYNSLYEYSFVEQIYSADEIGTAGMINSISFNMSSTDAQTNQVDVFMKNVSRATFADDTDYEAVTASDMVFSGTVTFNTGWTTITLDTPFQYDGTSNLMIAMHEYTPGYSTRYFYYTDTPNTILSYYSDSYDPDPYNLGSYSGTTFATYRRPNIQIEMTADGGDNGADQLHVKYLDGEEEIIDVLNMGVRPAGAWMEPFNFTMYTEGRTYTVNVLNFTPSDGLFSVAGEELPFQVVRDEDVALNMSTNGTEAGIIERQFVAITEGDRTAHIWPITVEFYAPEVPDVVELAYDLGTINAEYTYEGIPSEITPTVLHNDYTLPFPEIEEGVDAVYKFTVENDVIISAHVDEGAENGKVALYTEDFYGEGGPMAHNNYTGLSTSGGAAAAPFEVQIGEGTSTTTYFPFYTFYNYCIAENLYLAAELAEAGVTTAPMTSLSWYATNAPGYNQQGITIWMANVEDETLTTTSHPVTGMTKVYTGAMTPAIGWNEFVFNEGTFSWDGHSNVLIFCQRNNGEYNSSVSWQATASLPFNAMSYRYQDSGAYDATVANTMYTSTTRPNIIMKAAGRRDNRDIIFAEDFENGIGNWTTAELESGGGVMSGYGSHSGDNAFLFFFTYNPPQYLISPELTGTENGVEVSFYYAAYLDGFAESFQVGYSTTTNDINAFVFGEEIVATDSEWSEYTNTFRAGTKYVAVKCTSYNAFFLLLDDFTFTSVEGGGTGETGVSAGPVIEDLGLTAGTYYLVASATQADYTVYINIDEMPCPMIEAEGFAFNPEPADDADEIEPASVTLRWMIPEYATGWRLVFGSTYYPDPNHPQTIMYPEDGSFSNDMATSYTVRNLWNNTNYFWHVEFNNDGCPEGVSSPIWGFTTHLNIPQDLTAVDETVFDDEQIVLNWTPVVDRTYRMYNVYRDGELIGHTNTNQINNSTYTDGPLPYNMDGYTYYVTAVYDEGESAPSNTVNVKVSGYGNVDGHVYEQDGTTGIAGATVTMLGQDEFGVNHTYNFTTNAQGYYSGAVYAGSGYDGQAGKEGYQTAYEPVQGEPIVINYNQTTSPIDYILDENFDPVCGVIAEYYPDSLDPNSPYVKVYWGCGLPGGEIIEDFETGDFSMFDWQVDSNYPWTVTTYQPYEGTYCMKSGGAGVPSVISNMTVTVDIPADGIMSYYGKISCESNWDYGYFYIDGVQKAQYTGVSNWAEKHFDITAGSHTFQWRYTKDGSIDSNDDCFYVDYICFYKQPEPPQPAQPGWHTYAEGDFNNAVGSNVGTSRWAYEYPVSVIGAYAGFMMTKVSLFSDNQYSAVGGNYTCTIYQGGSLPMEGTPVSTITVDVPANQNAWVDFDLTTPVSITGSEKLWVVWTANSTVSSWPAGCTDVSLIEEGTWWSAGLEAGYDWEHETYGTWTMRQYFTNREGRGFYSYASDDAPVSVEVPAVVKGAPVMPEKGKEVTITSCATPNPAPVARFANGNRSLEHYRVYRTNCYNDGPYTEENTVLLATVWMPDTVYIDVEWADLEPGIYKWGVGAVYAGNRGELVEGPITWTAPQAFNRGNTADAPVVLSTVNESSLNSKTEMSRTSWLTYDDGVYVGGVGTYGPFSWGVMFPASMYNETSLTKVALFENSNNTETLTLSVYQGGITAPGTLLYTQVVTPVGGDDYHVIELNSAVTIDPSQNLWIVFSCEDGMNYPANGCENTGDPNGRWISFDGTTWQDITSFFLNRTWMIRAYVTNTGGGGSSGSGGISGPNELALPRESETNWSNCLDKDMFINGENGDGVTVNVLLNSADSPEGVQVTFTNYNEAEQELYPVAPIILDETGFYAFESFRKGNYKVNVTFDGYEPIEDSVSIWDPVDLRYVMTEIIYGVSDLYVSRTGWAMWEGEGPVTPPTPPTPPGSGDSFTDDFENGIGNWTLIDADGDGNNWYDLIGNNPNNIPGHNGSEGFATSASWNGSILYPDNYLVTPQLTLGGTFSFWACAQDASYPDETFGVAVSTTGNSNASDFTMLNQWTLTAKGVGAKAGETRSGSRDQGAWYQYSVDLSAYAGQSGYVAIRHFNCPDRFRINVDDVVMTTGAKDGDRHLEYYKVLCESIDHEPIFNANTVNPFCQLATDELVEGELYICKVAAVYSTGMSDYAECVWQYESCENYAGTVNGVAVAGNTISWDYPGGGPTPPTPPGQGDSFSVDFENSQIPAGWTTIDGGSPAGYGWQLASAKIGTGNGHNGSVDCVLSQSYDNNYGIVYPDNYLVSPQVTLANGSTFSFYACAQDESYAAEHFGVFVSDNGTSGWTMVNEWTMTAKGSGIATVGRDNRQTRQGSWHEYSVDLSAFAGQKYIAIRHFNCSDMFYLDVDDITLTSGAKGNRDVVFFNGYVTDPGAMANGADASWTKGSQSTWGPNVNNASGYKLGDSFTLSAATTINEIEVYGYQTGSSTTSTFTGLYAQIFNGNPMSGGTAIWGSETTNIMTATSFTNCYRGSDGETTATTRPIMAVTAGNLNIDLEAGTYWLVYGLEGTGTSGPWGAPHAEPGIGNTGNGVQYTTTGWQSLTDNGAGTTYGCAMKISGGNGGPVPPIPPTPSGDILGAMIFVDGEWEAFVPVPTNTYTYEGEGSEICVRIVYNGTAELPSNNFYYAMSCEECEYLTPGPGTCEPGAPIHSELVDENHIKVWWGEENPGPGGEGSTFSYDFDNSQLPAGWTTIDNGTPTGYGWHLASTTLGAGYGHNASTDCMISQSYDNNYGIVYPDNYLISEQVTFGSTSEFSLWACAQDAGYAAEHFGVFVSTTGTNPNDFQLVSEWTIGQKGERYQGTRGSRDQSAWLQYTANLGAYAGQTGYIAIRHFNCSDQYFLDIDDVELTNGAKNRANLVKYNVYRSTEANGTYTMIGEVAETGATYYEYIDSPTEAGTYYYQVRAEYDNECESEPAMAADDPTHNYVSETTTADGLDENADNVALYPNPTNGNVTIEAAGMSRITVVSVLGQVVYDTELNADSYILNMGQFNAGMYMVRVYTESGVTVKRVTVMQ